MFSKTRIFYYDNEPNKAVVGVYDDFIIEVPEITASYPYLTVGIPGAVHNWSTIPTNAYGLYCTFAEIQSLVENNDSFVPKAIEIVIGHTIPLARYPSTTNSTQLSFNNTIYSLIAENDDNYISTKTTLIASEIQAFARTFDGVDATSTGGTRATLPKRPMFFRIPYHSLPTTAVDRPTNETLPIPTAANTSTATTVNDTNRFEYGQTIAQLIDSYIPELLQNNDKIYTLYPGENQYQKEINSLDPKYCAIDCSGPSFNETVWQLDQRLNTLINRDITGRTADSILALPVIFQVKGNNDDTIPANLYDGSTQANLNSNWSRLTDIYCGREITDDYSTIIPKIFVKGVPIVDGTNNLVPHTFCCTITWTLHVECTPRSNMTTNRLQWRMTYPYLRALQTSSNILTTQYVHQGNFAKKPFRHNIFKRTPMLRFNNLPAAAFTSNLPRDANKNRFKNTVGNIIETLPDVPDDLAPNHFGMALPYGAGWYEGHATARTVPVNPPATFNANNTAT